MNKHSLLSASGAARWLECTPSARFEENFLKTSTVYADEGTAAHELCELTVRYWFGEIEEIIYEQKRDELSKGKYYTAEMLECAINYAEYIKSEYDGLKENCPDAVLELEVKELDYSNWVPEGKGTGDCIIVADNLLEIIDFKYGKGYRVEAENNPQMRLYALGAINRYGSLYDIEKIRTTIIQPRINASPASEEMTAEELFGWADSYVKPRAELAYSGQGEFNPNENTCKFCRAKEQCKARADRNLALFDDSQDSPAALLITPEEAGAILEKADDIKAWLDDLEKLVIKSLFEGGIVKGWKLVEGRSNRRFTDETKVAEAMKKSGYPEASIYERSLMSLSAMEKTFGKKEISEILGNFIEKPQGKPSLAPEKDKRPAFTPTSLVLEAFDED